MQMRFQQEEAALHYDGWRSNVSMALKTLITLRIIIRHLRLATRYAE